MSEHIRRSRAGPLFARTVAVLAAAVLAAGAAPPAEAWPERLEGHGGPVRGLSGDGKGGLLSASFDYTIIHWALSPHGGRVAARLVGHEAAVNDVEAVPGGRLAVSASDDGSVGLWDLAATELLTRWPGTGDKMLDVAVSPDGRLAAAAGWDHRVRIFDLEAREQTAVLDGHDSNVNTVAFSQDGRSVYAGAYDGTILRWDVEGGAPDAPIVSHGWGVNVVRILPDGTLLYGATDGTVALVDAAGGEEIATLRPHAGPVLAVAVDAEHDRLAVGGADGALRLYRLSDREFVSEFTTPYGPVWGLAFAPDGSSLYRAGLDDAVLEWQVDPAQAFEPLGDEFPRRFQVAEGEGGDPGQVEFRRKCSVCHTLTPDGGNRAGPTLYGLFGRRAGTVEDYPYSRALAESDIVWTEETVAQLFSEGPDIVTPGSKMPLQRLKNDLDRDALIGFLKEATAPRRGDQARTEGKSR